MLAKIAEKYLSDDNVSTCAGDENPCTPPVGAEIAITFLKSHLAIRLKNLGKKYSSPQTNSISNNPPKVVIQNRKYSAQSCPLYH